MHNIHLDDFDATLPEKMPVSVIIEKIPSQHDWIDFSYRAVGIVSSADETDAGVKLIHREEGAEQYLFSGLELELHIDECESYYHNLMSPQPGCFIVAGETEELGEMPRPYLVSLSFDEVHAYLEGDEEVFAVDIPPELYKWTEAFLLTHYVASKRKKRKLTDWKQQSGNRVILHHDNS